jgi:hypothetical protein
MMGVDYGYRLLRDRISMMRRTGCSRPRGDFRG